MAYTFSNAQTRRASREQARRAACPNCKAEPGAPCIGRSGERRISCHAERHEAFLQQDSVQPAPRVTREWRPKTTADPRMLFPCDTCGAWRSRAALAGGCCNECRREERGQPRHQGASRAQVAMVACPTCTALPPDPCMGVEKDGGGRLAIASHHPERWHAANQQLGLG